MEVEDLAIAAKFTGLAQITFYHEELRLVLAQVPDPVKRIQNNGSGHKKLTEQESTLLSAFKALVEPINLRRSGKYATLDLRECPSICRNPSKASLSDRPSDFVDNMEWKDNITIAFMIRMTTMDG